jgi:micrococcal nuclease
MKQNPIKYAMSRMQKRIIIAIIVSLVAGLSFVDHRFGKSSRPRLEAMTSTDADVRKYHLKTFEVVNIVDGDTIDIAVPDGKYDNTRIRLLGVDTPETKNPKVNEMYYGPEASEYAATITLGKNVTVIIDHVSDARDKYNRLLAYVQLGDGTILNELLIANGFGYADLRFQHSRLSEYTALQIQTVKRKVGLWKNVKKDQLPGWLNREAPDILSLRDME